MLPINSATSTFVNSGRFNVFFTVAPSAFTTFLPEPNSLFPANAHPLIIVVAINVANTKNFFIFFDFMN